MVRNKFITKSVRTVTLGEKLQEVRCEKRISLTEAARATRIQVKYLEKLEAGKFRELPADVYVRGFIRAYASYLGMNELLLIKAYDREREIEKNIHKKDFKEGFHRPVQASNFAITPKHLILTLSALLVFSGFFYIYHEANLFISTPRLVVLEPLDGSETGENVIRVSGMAERDAEVSINDQRVIVNDEGGFSEDVVIQSGVNILTIKAKNRFNKEALKTIQLRGNFAEETPDLSQAAEGSVAEREKAETLKLEIFVDPGPIWVAVSADGSLVFSGLLEAGSNKMFEAQEKIVISSARGNNTYVRIGGGEPQLLSTEAGMVKDLEFKNE